MIESQEAPNNKSEPTSCGAFLRSNWSAPSLYVSLCKVHKDDCERKRALCHFISTLLSFQVASLSFSLALQQFFDICILSNFHPSPRSRTSWPASPTPPSSSSFLLPVWQPLHWAHLSSNTTSPPTAKLHSARAMSRSYTWPRCVHEGLRIFNKHAGAAILSPAVSCSFCH